MEVNSVTLYYYYYRIKDFTFSPLSHELEAVDSYCSLSGRTSVLSSAAVTALLDAAVVVVIVAVVLVVVTLYD